jgi:hypothetical protein
MTVWRIAIDENGGRSSYEELKDRGVIAIGWHEIGSCRDLIGQSLTAVEQFVQSKGDSV